jgi:hypothetical protein
MLSVDEVGQDTPKIELIRTLRRQPDLQEKADSVLPESTLWHCYCELRRRGETGMEAHFLRSVRTLHRRRSIGSVKFSNLDTDPNEHKLVDDPMLAELWRAYKRCIVNQRNGPASQLLRDIEEQLSAA